MQKGHVLHFPCQACQHSVEFSVFELEKIGNKIKCKGCGLIYDFNDETLKRQLRLFENLCRQIQLSEEILSDTSVGVFVGDREIKIPFKILLSRLNSSLRLTMGNQPFNISFRLEPTTDFAFAMEPKNF
jgi:hypothetical protein